MPGVMRGLFDEMQDDPAKIERFAQTPTTHARWKLPFMTETKCVEARRGTDHPVGLLRLIPVRVDQFAQRRMFDKFLIPAWERTLEIAPFDPPPFDLGQMVEDSRDREQTSVRRPSRLFVGETISGGDYFLALSMKETEK